MNFQQVLANDQQYYMNTFGPRTPVLFTRGEGVKLYDDAGKEYIDFFAGIAVNSMGYNHPAVKAALLTQIETGIWHTSNVFYTEPQQHLAKLLCQMTGFDRVFISNSGTEAVEGALKLARKYHYEKGQDRPKVISALGSFHGRTLAAVAATGQPKYQKPYQSLLPASIQNVPYNHIGALKEAVSGGDVCAILLECIQGEGGIIPADAQYLKDVRALCDEQDVLLIFDEIQTGLCRTGKTMAFMHYDVKPDIVTVAKALGNGLPIGAFLAKQGVADAFQPGDHGSTFGGNPLACAAAVATLAAMGDENIAQKALETGAYLIQQVKEQILPKTDAIVEVRGKGLLIGLQLKESVAPASVQKALLDKGFVVGTAGGNTLRLAPPLIIGKAQVDALIPALLTALQGGD